jgi:hypothetical protein
MNLPSEYEYIAYNLRKWVHPGDKFIRFGDREPNPKPNRY